jgi:hypothetical protein
MAIRAKKMCRHCLLVPYQNQIPSGPACGKGVGLTGLYSQGLSPRALPAWIGINPGDYDVLACRQVATVVSAFGKASYVLAINGHYKAQIRAEVCDPINEQMT